jgi:adenosylcobyric acid synthase
VSGYEIHMGETERGDAHEAFTGEGAVSDDGLVIGTYLHGLFENPSAATALLSFLYLRKGLTYMRPSEDQWRDPYDALADEFERYVTIDPILALFDGKDVY